MDQLSKRIDQLSPLQRAVFALKESQAKLEALQRAQSEPIAIIGMSCRFPGGVTDPASYWELLRNGVDAVREVPPDRWDADAYYDPDPKAPGKMNTRWGGFLDRVDGFDNRFFGVSAQEAPRLDPQQRLLLELAWEALEDAGQVPSRLVGSRTGVFVGVSVSDYGLVMQSDLRADAYLGAGTALCVAANRISFAFDFHGPSVALDTACSSSLVAVHLACQSLRSGESRLALAGGSSIILSPVSNINLTKAGFSAPDGRCRSFAANGAGYVRSEGCGLVVLKPLAAALADGDPVYAVIRGSAVSQDGRSNGLTAPNRAAQEFVLREAYARAKVSPGEVRFLEAQGTGTPLGDAIEAQAIASVLAEGRAPGTPCWLGAVKSNLGHQEAAAGVASLMKVALALKHRAIPPNLHADPPNPNIPFDQLPLIVPRTLTPWPATPAGSAVAGVSALGFGGTNSHAVLQEAPAPATVPAAAPEGTTLVLPLSAKAPEPLGNLARAYRDFLAGTSERFQDICHTAGARRDHHDHRLAVVCRTRDEAVELLDACARGEARPGLVAGCKPYGRRPKAVFVFTGDRRGWPESASALRGRQPAFAQAFDACAEIIKRLAGWSPAALLDAGPADPRWSDPAFALPTLFALQTSFDGWWRSLGVTPDAVLGSGEGEPAAACAAGLLSLEDGARVALNRGRRAAGQAPAVLTVGVRPPAIPYLSAVNGLVRDAGLMATAYWNQPLEGADAGLSALRERNPDVALEVGPAVLHDRLAACVAGGSAVASFAAEAAGHEAVLHALAALYAAGLAVEWDRLPSQKGSHVRVPTYPWQRERFWIDTDRFRLFTQPSANGVHADHAAPNGQPVPSAAQQPPADWCYELRWEPRPLEQPAAPPAGRWLVLADQAGVGAELAARMRAAGNGCETVSAPADGNFDRALDAALGADPTGWAGIVHLWALDAPAPEALTATALDAARKATCGSVLGLLRKLAEAGGTGSPRLWLATRGAQPAGEHRQPVAIAQAPLWGLGRTVATEHPRFWGGLIDLDPSAPPADSAAALCEELESPDGEDQVARRGRDRLVARIARRPAPPAALPHFRPDGAYLLTGGLGDRGHQVARWLVAHGARRIILLDRTALPERTAWAAAAPDTPAGRQIAAVRELEALGVSVHLATADPADEDQVAAALAAYRAAAWPPVRGVFHVADDPEPRPLARLDAGELAAPFRDRAAAAWVLHRALADEPLDCFVLFSTAASVLGSPLLGAAGAAGAFLDAVADDRLRRGLPALCIHWGAWAEPVRAGQRPADAPTFDPHAARAFAPAEALEILGRLTAAGPGRWAALPLTPAEWLRRPPAPAESALRQTLLAEQAAAPVTPRPDLTTPYVAPQTELERKLAALWAETFKIDRVGVHDNFLELGGDSLTAMQMLNRLQEEMKGLIHIWALFEAKTIHELAAYLRREYPVPVKGMCPTEHVEKVRHWNPDWPEVIDAAQVERARGLFMSIIRQKIELRPPTGPKNPRAVFILSPPRSGSTLFRVMLAGHPGLFAPPELELLPFNTLAERKMIYAGQDSFWLEGTVRALMEVRGCDAGVAQTLMRQFEQSGMTVQEFYRMLQQSIGGRTLVDKTPGYSINLEALRRAEDLFEDALYIHLLRHPCGMIRSYADYRLDQTMFHRTGGRVQNPFSTEQTAEIVYVVSQQNILKFLEGVPAHRRHRLPFEELVKRPEAVLRDLCRFLGLDYHPDMADPYRDTGRRMTDGTRPDGRMQGDKKFLTKKSIDPTVADRWAQEMTTDALGEPARAIAAELGYDIPPAPPRGSRRPEAAPAAPPAAIPRLARDGGAEELLGRLDQLSEGDVDSLLGNLLPQAGGADE